MRASCTGTRSSARGSCTLLHLLSRNYHTHVCTADESLATISTRTEPNWMAKRDDRVLGPLPRCTHSVRSQRNCDGHYPYGFPGEIKKRGPPPCGFRTWTGARNNTPFDRGRDDTSTRVGISADPGDATESSRTTRFHRTKQMYPNNKTANSLYGHYRDVDGRARSTENVVLSEHCRALFTHTHKRMCRGQNKQTKTPNLTS